MKQYKWSEKVLWAKKYIDAIDKIECRDEFIKSFDGRYDESSWQERSRAHTRLKTWVKLYNSGMKNLKSKSGIHSKGRPKKSPITKLNENDLEIYQEIVEELLKRKGVTKSEITEELRKRKEKINDKKNLSSLLGVERKIFYYLPSGRAYKVIDSNLLAEIDKCRNENYKVYGYHKIYLAIKEQNKEISEWNVRKHYESLNVRSRRFDYYYHKPKEAKSTNVKGPNLVGREYTGTHSNEKWFTDISYIRLKSGRFIYLSLIIDSFSNKVIYWTLSFINDEQLAIKTLSKAIQISGKPKIIHTDHGTIYFAKHFQNLLKKLNIKHSLSGVGNSLDNRPAEFVFGLIKHEGIYHDELNTFYDAEISLDNYVNWYNKNRIQTNLKNMSPDKYLETYSNRSVL